MPTYEYICHDCQTRFEIKQSINDPTLNICEDCFSDNVERLISRPAYLDIPKDPREAFKDMKMEAKKIAGEMRRGNQAVINDMTGRNK